MKSMRKLFWMAGVMALLMLPVQAEDSDAAVYMPAAEEKNAWTESGETMEAFQDWKNIQWEFSEDTGTLTITGENTIPGWSLNDTPWAAYADQVKTVVVGEGITRIDGWVLDGQRMPYTAIHLPSTLEYVANYFFDNTALQTITVAEGGRFYAVDNVLFCREGEHVTLVWYPGGLQNREYAVPEGVTKIGRSAITNTNLRSFTLPESLQEIGYVAFDGTYNLTEITIPSGVSEIDLAAFVYCGLQNIYVEADNPYYTSVDGVLFTKDMSLLHTYPGRKEGSGEYTVPDGVTDVTSTVMSLSYIRKLNLPASVERLCAAGTGASSSAWLREICVAEDNPHMTSIDGILYSKDVTELLWYPNRHSNTVYTVPETVEHIYGSSFWWISNLQTVIFNDKMSVDGFLQWGDTLKAVYFPGDVPVWLSDACRSVRNQATLYYPKGNPTWTDGSMTYDGDTYTTAAYGEGEEDTTVWNTWKNIQWKFDNADGTLYIGGEGEIPDVSLMDFPWYEMNAAITSLVIEEGITSIPEFTAPAAYGYKLTSVSLPSTIEFVAPRAFRNAETLRGFTMAEGSLYYAEDGVLFIEDVDWDYRGLVCYPAGREQVSYTIPEGVTQINEYSVWDTDLQTLILPDSLESISWNAIASPAMTTIHIPKGVHGIDRSALILCDNLASITVDPENPYFTAKDGVLFDRSMKTLCTYPPAKPAVQYTIPDGVEEVSSSVLRMALYLEELHIPASAATIRECTVYNSSVPLHSITIDPNNQNFTIVDDVIFTKDMHTMIYYPFAKEDAMYCIPDGVTTIQEYAMMATKHLQYLFMGKDVVTIERRFSWMHDQLQYVYFSGDVPAYLNKAFSNLNTSVVLCFPKGNKTWTEGTMTVDGVTYTTSSFRLKADVSGDGTINENDLSLLTQYYSGYPTEIDESIVDLDGSGTLTRKDIMILARYLAGWEGYSKYFN